MAAHTDFEPLSWEEAEQNRGSIANQYQRRRDVASLATRQAPFTGFLATLHAPPPPVAPNQRQPVDTIFEQCERLRAEIKRGSEYLDQLHRELAESRSLLESWPIYERNCGKNPLAQLTESVLVNQRASKFLATWVKRRERRLQTMTKAANKALARRKSLLASKSPRNGAARSSKRSPLKFPENGDMHGKATCGRELVAA
ncbi:MAG: hypothetical protein C5B50_07555 [Verrucomicrobia bacterium]|nr:MAG: hypothetical protein C5B50_07555 [Verrucomicrobiota bacterium]